MSMPLNLPRDHRGLVIPFLMMRGSQITVDPKKWSRCAREKLCMICGKRLSNKKWFIGGQSSAVHRLFVDPAMHEECARYALAHCPFLNNQSQKYHVKAPENSCPIEAVRTERSETVILFQTNGFKAVKYRGQAFIFANRWEHVEHWRNGERVPDPINLSVLELKATNGVLDAKVWIDELR